MAEDSPQRKKGNVDFLCCIVTPTSERVLHNKVKNKTF